MTVFKKIITGLFFVVGWASVAHAGVISSMDAFTNNDRILVLAPHPDDEAIGTGGVIQEARKAGAKVKVVLLTNGENNELSFIVYKKRPVFIPKEFISMGEMRYKESLSAVQVLGLAPEDVVSLGYPDYGTMEVLTRFWDNAKPFRSMFSRVKQVPYPVSLSPKATYVGESILSDLEKVIEDFRPTRVFVSHPADTNRDHRALYLFLRVALWDLRDKIEQPRIFPYIIHVVGWPKPRGYHSDQVLYVPDELIKSDITWTDFNLDASETLKKYEAITRYVSQVKYAPSYLVSFARRNEIFGDYPDVPLIRQMSSEVAWQYVGTGDENVSPKKTGKPSEISSVAYAQQGANLLVRVVLKRAIDKEMGVSVFLLGYKKGVPFGQMPKLNLLVGIDGFHVKDRRKNVSSKEVLFHAKDKELFFTIPLWVMGNPNCILGSAKTSIYDLTLDETAWRILILEETPNVKLHPLVSMSRLK